MGDLVTVEHEPGNHFVFKNKPGVNESDLELAKFEHEPGSHFEFKNEPDKHYEFKNEPGLKAESVSKPPRMSDETRAEGVKHKQMQAQEEQVPSIDEILGPRDNTVFPDYDPEEFYELIKEPEPEERTRSRGRRNDGKGKGTDQDTEQSPIIEKGKGKWGKGKNKDDDDWGPPGPPQPPTPFGIPPEEMVTPPWMMEKTWDMF